MNSVESQSSSRANSTQASPQLIPQPSLENIPGLFFSRSPDIYPELPSSPIAQPSFSPPKHLSSLPLSSSFALAAKRAAGKEREKRDEFPSLSATAKDSIEECGWKLEICDINLESAEGDPEATCLAATGATVKLKKGRKGKLLVSNGGLRGKI